MSEFSWSYSKLFAREFPNFPEDQRVKIAEFIATYVAQGLADFSKFEGKITPSWTGLNSADEKYRYAKDNNLWHYHIGIPAWNVIHSKYKTSDWVLHFQWQQGSNEISIVDCCYHYTSDGVFYLPSANYLLKSTKPSLRTV